MLEIKKVSIDSIHEDPNNARKHNIKNISAIKGSIAKFGQVEPLVVKKDTHVIIGGNGRYFAMKEMGITEVDIVEIDINNFDASALSLALNRTSELAEWDDEILNSTLEALKSVDFDLPDIGFDIDDKFEPNIPNEKNAAAIKPLTLIITCDDDDTHQSLFIELRDRGYKIKI